MGHNLQDLYTQRRHLNIFPTTLSPPIFLLSAAPSVVYITSSPGYCRVPYSVTVNNPIISLSSVLSSKSTDTNYTIPTAYLVPSFSKSTYMCFTDYIPSTEPTEFHSTHTSIPSRPDPINITFLINKFPLNLASKQASAYPTLQSSNITNSAPALQTSIFHLPLLLKQHTKYSLL